MRVGLWKLTQAQLRPLHFLGPRLAAPQTQNLDPGLTLFLVDFVYFHGTSSTLVVLPVIRDSRIH